jgi:hypothetical protein
VSCYDGASAHVNMGQEAFRFPPRDRAWQPIQPAARFIPADPVSASTLDEDRRLRRRVEEPQAAELQPPLSQQIAPPRLDRDAMDPASEQTASPGALRGPQESDDLERPVSS